LEVAAALDSRYCSAAGQSRAGGLKREREGGRGKKEGGRERWGK
jgi:hypothetical protein